MTDSPGPEPQSRLRPVPPRPRTLLLMALVLLVAIQLLAAAWAPLRTAETAPTTVSEPMEGRALFPGAIVGDTRYGVTFTGQAGGAVPGWWTVTVNYSPPSADGGMINDIRGGKWQVTLLENGLYRGTLFGDVTAGQIVRDPTGVYADVWVEFLVTGGTGTYAAARGSGRLIDGKADHTPFPPTLAGELVLQLEPDGQEP